MHLGEWIPATVNELLVLLSRWCRWIVGVAVLLA